MAPKTTQTTAEVGPALGNAAGGPSQPNPQRGSGQRVSQERGTSTRNKKNPGKRAHQGGG